MSLAEAFDIFLIDLDGVLYVGDRPVEHAPEAVSRLKRMGKRVLFITNDPRHTAHRFAEKLSSMGIEASGNDVVTSVAAVIHHLLNDGLCGDGTKALVIGTDEMKGELREAGIELCTLDDWRRARLVIVGGHEGFNYAELRAAALAVGNGAAIIGTNRDPAVPSPEGMVPGTGAIIAALETATGKKATVVGKPEKTMFETALARAGVRGRAVVVGDRLDSDIEGGKRSGLDTVLVLTGSTTKEEVERAHVRPDYVIGDLEELFEADSAP